jgi:hypothetical protein
MSTKKKSKGNNAAATQNTAPIVLPKSDYRLSGESKTHTDVVGEIRKIQAEQAVASANAAPGVPFDFSKVHLHLGMPCYGGLVLESTMTSFIKFILMANKIGLSWSFDTMVNESLITRGRNNLMAKMIYNKAATHFMFIDADIKFDPESIFHMIAADKDIIAGAYPKKSLPIQVNLNLKQQTKIQGPLFTVDTAATGFLLFKRKVYEDLIAAHPNTKYVDDIGLGKQYEPFMYAIFDCYIDEKGHYLSEDWAFCRRADKLGYDIWMDSRVKLDHVGTYTFCGDLDLIGSQLGGAIPKV